VRFQKNIYSYGLMQQIMI